MRKRRRRYKLLAPLAPAPAPRGLDLATLGRWGGALFLAGVMVALLLVLSLFTRLQLGAQFWLDLWPASIRLMTTPGLGGHQATHMAVWLAGENGLLYGSVGVLLGGAHVGIRALRRRRRA